MTADKASSAGFFSAPTEEGLRLASLFVLPGETLRLRWEIFGWGWVIAKTNGDIVEKNTHFFFGETSLEFKLRIGQEILIQIINPFGRVSKRFIAVPNVGTQPMLPESLKSQIANAQLTTNASLGAGLVQPNSMGLDTLLKNTASLYVHGPQIINVKPNDVQGTESEFRSALVKPSESKMPDFNFSHQWATEWRRLSMLTRNPDSHKGVSNVNQ